MAKEKKTLTLRQYAKQCGTSHQTVSKAITERKIVEGYDEETGRINSDVADLEWGLDFMQRQLTKKIKPQKPGGEIEIDDEDWNPFGEDQDPIPKSTKLNELVRLELLYKARMAKLKVEKEVGKLVDKESMYREMFKFGQEIRTALQAIPDRIIDNLISLDRHSAHKLLKQEINDVLEKLADKENEDSD